MFNCWVFGSANSVTRPDRDNQYNMRIVYWVHMCDSTQGSLYPSPMKICQSMWIQWPFFQKNLNQGSLTPRWPLIPKSVGVTCVTLPKDHCVHVQWKYIKVCGYSDPFFKNLNQRSLTPRCPLTPCLLRAHVWLYPRIIVSKWQWKYIKVCGYSEPFFKNLNQRSLTPRWPLTPCLLRSHVWLYPRISVSKSHGNTSMYVDTVINFTKYDILHSLFYEHSSGETKIVVFSWSKLSERLKHCIKSMLYSDCLQWESNFWLQPPSHALCVCVCCIAYVCDCLVIREPMRK